MSQFRCFLLVVCYVFSVHGFAEALPDLPSIQKAVESMSKQQQSNKKAKKFSKEDMAIMKKASEELKKNLPNPGLKVGTKAPDFILPNAYGKNIKLSDLYKKGPVILTFYRGAWCPFCNIELHALKVSMPHFKKYNAQIIAVTPQKPDKSLEQVKKSKLPFNIVSDLDNSVMKKYNLFFELAPELVNLYKKLGLDIESYNGKGRNVLPVPGTFVIDQKGIIRASFSDLDYKKRMEPKAILAALKTL